MTTLKKCPFCGSPAEYDWGSTRDVGGRLYQDGWVECTNSECNASIEVESVDGNLGDKDLVDKWNKRVS